VDKIVARVVSADLWEKRMLLGLKVLKLISRDGTKGELRVHNLVSLGSLWRRGGICCEF
jgi:hypothetical protein